MDPYSIIIMSLIFLAGLGLGWGIRGCWKRGNVSFYCRGCTFVKKQEGDL